MTAVIRDITADIGPMGKVAPQAVHAMYSYERPAYMLWQAVYEGLLSSGHSHKQAIDWLQSKSPRWALDGELGDRLYELGLAFGKTQNP